MIVENTSNCTIDIMQSSSTLCLTYNLFQHSWQMNSKFFKLCDERVTNEVHYIVAINNQKSNKASKINIDVLMCYYLN